MNGIKCPSVSNCKSMINAPINIKVSVRISQSSLHLEPKCRWNQKGFNKVQTKKHHQQICKIKCSQVNLKIQSVWTIKTLNGAHQIQSKSRKPDSTNRYVRQCRPHSRLSKISSTTKAIVKILDYTTQQCKHKQKSKPNTIMSDKNQHQSKLASTWI